MERVIACDLGNKHSGIVVAKLEPEFEVVYLRLVITDKEKDLLEFMKQNESVLFSSTPRSKTIMVYENLYMPNKGGFRNFRLMHIQKAVRKYFKEDFRCQVKALIPSQKAIVGGYSKKDKKQKAEEAARQFLNQEQLAYFDSEPRKHDLADAILMARYIYNNK